MRTYHTNWTRPSFWLFPSKRPLNIHSVPEPLESHIRANIPNSPLMPFELIPLVRVTEESYETLLAWISADPHFGRGLLYQLTLTLHEIRFRSSKKKYCTLLSGVGWINVPQLPNTRSKSACVKWSSNLTILDEPCHFSFLAAFFSLQTHSSRLAYFVS